jgi:hypothetical protein
MNQSKKKGFLVVFGKLIKVLYQKLTQGNNY